MSYSTANGSERWGAVMLEGDDDLSIGGSAYMRSVGMGIEGKPVRKASESGSVASGSRLQTGLGPPPSSPTTSAMRRTSAMSWSSANVAVGSSLGHGKGRQISASSESEGDHDDGLEWRDRQLLTTLSLLQTFHAQSAFQLSVLESFLPRSGEPSGGLERTVYLSPKDVLAFELGPLSASDARYLEWLAEEYAGPVKVVVKRSWRDLFGAIFA